MLASTDPSFVVTELDWPIEALFVLGGTLNSNFCCNRLHVTIEGWGKVASKSVKMLEQDFFSTSPALLTNFSLSPNTNQTTAYLIFVEGCYDFFDCCPFKLGALLGYQYSQFNWNAKGGSQINIIPSGSLVVFPNVTVVSYKQQFSVPYFGFIAKWERSLYNASLFGKYSPIAFAKDIDHHNFFPYAGFTFTDRFCNKNYWIVGAKIGVWLTHCLNFDFKYSYEAFEKSVGKAVIKTPTTTTTLTKGAKIYHCHNTFELGLSAHF